MPTAKQQAIELIKHFEGCRLDAYLCPAGVWTIGWGQTGSVNSRPITEGMKISQRTANTLLTKYVDSAYDEVKRVTTPKVFRTLNDHQQWALISFVYNIGIGAYSRSTLLKKLKDGDSWGAANEFKRWNKAKRKVLPGLTRRRASERNLFCGFKKPIVEGQ